MRDSLFLSLMFDVDEKETSQTAFGGQLPYQGSQRGVPYINTNGSWAGRSWCLWS